MKWDKKKIENRVKEICKVMRIEEYVDRYPAELSGGQQQSENAVDAQVESSLPSGMETILVTKVGSQRLTSVIFGDVDFKSGENLKMGFSGNKYQLFNGDSGERLTSGSLEV